MPRLRKPMLTAALLIIPFLASGCSSKDLPVSTIAAVNAQVVKGYRLSAGDQLKVTVFDEPELTGEFKIGDGGVLALPLIETIAANGLTANQLTELIAQRYQEGGFVLAPRVSVEILQHRPFYILGEVNEPGEYVYAGELTLDQAIAKAGGYTARADRGSVILQREDWDRARILKLDGSALQIVPGDTITIRESFF